ncbi:MAG: DNA polymerase III subunit gamma/tau, partial [Clostridium sp.]|nr:DNA polymerase III subunit gamma/tau [Clostridium sp.]
EPVFDEPAPPVWQMEKPAPAPRRPKPTPAPEPAPVSVADGEENRTFWPSFAAGLRGKITPAVMPLLNNPQKVTGVWKNGKLTLWADSEFTRSMLNKPAILDGIAKAANTTFGVPAVVSVVTGAPPAAPAEKQVDGGDPSQALDELLSFAQKFDNVTIQ